MKKRKIIKGLLCSSFLVGFVLSGPVAQAESQTGDGTIKFTGEYGQEIVDPENPDNVVDPGETPQTQGDLRIDFVPRLRFGNNRAVDQDASYSAFAQLFHDDTSARGNFVQVSDFRSSDSGWQLSVRQEDQFVNENGKELNGAMLSLDKSWANSKWDSTPPVVKKDVINMTVGESQILATAEEGTGKGTWSICFGASATNSNGQADTLTPLLDDAGNPVTDSLFGNKPIFLNSAVQLSVPGQTTKEAGTTYKTVLTWTLSELP